MPDRASTPCRGMRSTRILNWLNYVRVEGAAATATKLVALGGKMLVAPRVDRHGGKVAVVADPIGAPFGLLQWPENESKEVIK